MSREHIELWLFGGVSAGTCVAQVASTAHMIQVLGYANSGFMAWALAVVTVLMMGVLTALSVLHQGSRSVQWALRLGIGLLGFVEFVGNYGAGGLLLAHQMPQELPAFFGLSHDAGTHWAAFLFAGYVPVLVWVSVYAIASTARRFLQPAEVNRHADAVLQGTRLPDLQVVAGAGNSSAAR